MEYNHLCELYEYISICAVADKYGIPYTTFWKCVFVTQDYVSVFNQDSDNAEVSGTGTTDVDEKMMMTLKLKMT